MLTKEDLQAISELIHTEIDTAIKASEERTTNRIMAYIESDVKPDIRKIAEGYQQLSDRMDRVETKLDRVQSDVDEIKGELVAQEFVIKRRLRADAVASKGA